MMIFIKKLNFLPLFKKEKISCDEKISILESSLLSSFFSKKKYTSNEINKIIKNKFKKLK